MRRSWCKCYAWKMESIMCVCRGNPWIHARGVNFDKRLLIWNSNSEQCCRSSLESHEAFMNRPLFRSWSGKQVPWGALKWAIMFVLNGFHTSLTAPTQNNFFLHWWWLSWDPKMAILANIVMLITKTPAHFSGSWNMAQWHPKSLWLLVLDEGAHNLLNSMHWPYHIRFCIDL